MKILHKKSGFTLIEILLVIAIMAILAAIVIVAINPAKQLGQAQNTQRISDVRTILDAVIQYSLDNGGTLPGEIPEGDDCPNDGEDICKVDVDCEAVVLDELAETGVYLTEMPEDPANEDILTTGYAIMQNSYGRVSVCATQTYDDVVISVTK